MKQFGVVVVGGGHAGIEAATAAARFGVNTALITHRFDRIGEMSCNPAIGGLGKGHLVREVDALDGVMARIADRAAIQYRLLNRKKGPAVQGPRSQIDRALYRKFMQSEIAQTENLTVIEGEVAELTIMNSSITGIRLSDGLEIPCSSVVLTTGTFLGGEIHIGTEKTAAGRVGDPASNILAKQLREMSLPIGRLKTGTPPRLNSKTIDWASLEMQAADEEPTVFSFMNHKAEQAQIACGISYTNEQTHEIITENIHLSAMYSGNISGTGPRYCPSIEDKVSRFADKSSHQVFLEPEGLNDDTVYPNGISTSLPRDIQDRYVQSMKGLEAVEILQYGYAIEYDYIDPRALNRDFSLQNLSGLYLAGQINGTTGYEEAAAQGLVAGLNAARQTRGESPLILERSNSYIGVLIDDLVTRGVSEPYRMFTSRAEYRLSLRADNADQRLTPIGIDVGVVSETRKNMFHVKQDQLEAVTEICANTRFTANDSETFGFRMNRDGKKRSLLDVFSYPDAENVDYFAFQPELSQYSPLILQQVAIDAKYAHYVERQKHDIESLRRDEAIVIPSDLDFSTISGLSNELRSKLAAHRPNNIAEAQKLEGMTPAAIGLIITILRKRRAS